MNLYTFPFLQKTFETTYEKAHPTCTLFHSQKKEKKKFVRKIYIKCGFKFDHNNNNWIIENLFIILIATDWNTSADMS